MTAEDLFVDLHLRGIRFRTTADGLRYRAPSGAMTPELRNTIIARRGEILALLTPNGALPNEIYIPPCMTDEEYERQYLEAHRPAPSVLPFERFDERAEARPTRLPY